MGNTCCCCCCLQREHRDDDYLDNDLEDKLLGKHEDVSEATTAEEEAWRQRLEQLRDEEDMTMLSLNENDVASSRTSLMWDLSDRNMVFAIQKGATDLVEDDEDDEVFGSAEEGADEDEEYQESTDHGDDNDGFDLDRLTQVMTRDSYASSFESFRNEESQVFRDTELDGNTADMSDTFLASTLSSSLRDSVHTSTFLENESVDVQVQEDQEQERNDQKDEELMTEKPRSSSLPTRSRAAKKKKRSKKSMRK